MDEPGQGRQRGSRSRPLSQTGSDCGAELADCSARKAVPADLRISLHEIRCADPLETRVARESQRHSRRGYVADNGDTGTAPVAIRAGDPADSSFLVAAADRK